MSGCAEEPHVLRLSVSNYWTSLKKMSVPEWIWICKPLIFWRIRVFQVLKPDALKEHGCSTLYTLLLLLVFTLDKISVFEKFFFFFLLAKTLN